MKLTSLTAEATEAFRTEVEGHWPKGALLYTDQHQTILCRSRAERKFLKIWSPYDVGNGLYRVFTSAKRALSL
jgi:hypothetical protein